MRKMLNLVLNEYIKVLAKVSTIIMLAVIVVVSVGYNLIIWVSSTQIGQMQHDPEWQREVYDQQIKYAQEEKYPGWEQDVERLTAMRDSDTQLTWRQNATNTIYMEYKSQLESTTDPAQIAALNAKIDRLQKALDNNDWRDYINAQYIEPYEAADISEEERETVLWMWRYCLEHDIEPTQTDENGKEVWVYGVLEAANSAKWTIYDQMQRPEAARNQEQLATARETLLMQEYRLENDIAVIANTGSDTFSIFGGYWAVFSASTGMLSVISVLIIIVAGGIVASEFSKGTIKFLLINPVKRWKILTAKYISIITIALVMLALAYLVNALLPMLFFGVKELGAPYLTVSGDAVRESSAYLRVAGSYLLTGVGTAVMATFAFALSSLVRNAALSIGLGIFLMLSGSSVVSVLGMLNFDWARYIVFANTDLVTIQSGGSPFMEHTVLFAILNLVVYMLVFLLTAWDGFVRRDIR